MKVGDRISVSMSDTTGKIAGFGTAHGELMVLVWLDEGMWDEGRKHWISMICVHHSNIEILEECE